MRHPSQLTLRHDFLDQPDLFASYTALLHAVFSIPAPRRDAVAPEWHPIALFAGDGRCVATLEIGLLTILADGARQTASGIRLVAVAEAWRGQGLFRDLMHRAIAGTHAGGPVLLYTGDAALYRRFDFRPVPQFAFLGAAPAAVPGFGRVIDGADADRGLLERLLASRAPLSHQAAILDAPGLFLERIGADEDLVLVHSPQHDALIVYEAVDDMVILVDVVAASLPSMASILGALPVRAARVKTLFSPDRLDWRGEPVREDTGLMVRGVLPGGLDRPFMLPPTTEF